LRTKNSYDQIKIRRLAQADAPYVGVLDIVERVFLLLKGSEREVKATGDEGRRPSVAELAAAVERLFPGKHNLQKAIKMIENALSRLRKDPRYPLVRPYKKPVVEMLVDGSEVIRNYIAFLMGKAFVAIVNARAQRRIEGERRWMKQNEKNVNIRKVTKELDEYERQLIAKANSRRRRGRGSSNP